jgi:hypothetical protein
MADHELIEDHEREHFAPALGEDGTQREGDGTALDDGTVHEPATDYQRGRIDERESDAGRFDRGADPAAEQPPTEPGARRS